MTSISTKVIGFARILLRPDLHRLGTTRGFQHSVCRLSIKTDGHDVKADKSIVVSKKTIKEIFQKEFPDHFRDGKFISRMSYVEFIDEALEKAVELGIHKEAETYKEVLRVFPPGRFWPKDTILEGGFFHAPQQLAAMRVFVQMNRNGVKTDGEFEQLVIDAFSRKSDLWVQLAMLNYWTMKNRNLNPYPLPEKLPDEPHQLAKLGIARMMTDEQSLVTVTNTSNVPECVDKTWLVFAQSPTQKAILDRLDEKSTLYIEEGGLSYVGDAYLSYYMLKFYVDEETQAEKHLDLRPKPDFNYNTLKMGFFGKPIKHKLNLIDDKHYTDGYYVLSIAATGTSSQDSLLSWLKILQQRNPNLSKLNVVFKMSKRSPELIEYDEQQQQQKQQQSDQSSKNASNQKQAVS